MAVFKVLRHHQGDRDYSPGETRNASPSDVAHLVALGVLEAMHGDDGKAEEAPLNKVEKPHANKSRRAASGGK